MTLQQTADELMPELRRHQRQLLAAGAAGLLVSLVGWFFNATQFYQSYLMAYMLCLSVTLGCLALGMIHQLSGGAWGVVIRRPIGAASRVLPVMTLLFVPVLLGMSHLYIWTHADVVAHDAVLSAKHAYLNVPFFLARTAIYFASWNAISYFLNAWSLEQDRRADPRIARKMQLLSAGGLVVYGLTITFVMLWAYFSFSQYLIIWAGNLPQEISWYVNRLQTGWRFIGVALVLFHFIVPFVLLLSRTMKREGRLIVKVAVAILLSRLLDLFWLIAPEFHA